jgi:hypothetical protein
MERDIKTETEKIKQIEEETEKIKREGSEK